ncbi:3D domain-containing protein [Clostridium sp. BJN0001]|uniref:3D domain-containing protein n=1 Tax=Clostridium sp. BJN0001 TaxID=2930219 RepID=UPI001FD25E51|nr:3D domain-containing protein [Clostridium sp. BJN0001]
MSKKKIIIGVLSLFLASALGAILGILKYNNDYNYTFKNNYKILKSEDTNKTNKNAIYSDKDIDITNLQKLDCELTAYCGCYECSKNFGITTALETEAKIGIVAAPVDIPLGTMLYIPSLKYLKEDGIFYIEDRGEAVTIKNNDVHIIDVYLPKHEDTIEFGRKKSDAYIIK